MILMMGILGCGLGAQEVDSHDACATRQVPLNYANFGEPFLERHCTGCHSTYLEGDRRFDAPPGIDLNSFQAAVTYKSRIQARVLDPESPQMPPGGGPTELELSRLQEWLDCGLEVQ
ncbi:MAG: hypothetical protein ACI9VR_002284 [Cognaticolwellia sp.]|jgi:hypothetical protein